MARRYRGKLGEGALGVVRVPRSLSALAGVRFALFDVMLGTRCLEFGISAFFFSCFCTLQHRVLVASADAEVHQAIDVTGKLKGDVAIKATAIEL